MKAILEFDIDELEDKEAHFRCVKSLDMAIALFNIRSSRKEIESKINTLSKKRGVFDNEILDIVFEEINDIFEDKGINMEDLLT